MANIYPSSTTAVSPYSEYNSNVVNKLTRMVTMGENCIKGTHSCEVSIDTTSPTSCLLLSTGVFFKDDCYHSIDSIFNIDMSDEDFYVDSSGGYWNEAGYYIIAAAYTYVKSKPAPRVSIKIFKPSQYALFNSGYLFLNAVNVIFNGASFEIDSILGYLPADPTIKRTSTKTYIDSEDTLPVFDTSRDEGRIIYVKDTEMIYFGQSGRWETVQAIRDVIDTYDCTIGQLGYIGTDGRIHPAIATSNLTLASCVVLQVGYRVDGSGQVRLYGVAENVPVEPGRTIEAGEQCYLSATNAGTVTDLIPANYPQYLGRSITDSTGVDTITLWFQPGSGTSTGSSSNLYDFYQDLLISSTFVRMSVDAFINQDYVDMVNTTAELDTINYQINGENGEKFYSINLVDNDPDSGYDGTCVTSCMIVTQGTHQEYQTWYVTNNGNDANPDWEIVDLNEIHYFASDYVMISDSTGVFEVGELIVGSTSGLSGEVVMDYSTDATPHLLVYDITGSGSFTVGETITGSSSGSTATIDTGSYKRDSNVNVIVRCDFSGTSSIEDYGLFYEINTTIVETVPENSRNIDTLFADLYTTPSEDNDGLANLVVPLETCKTNLQTFVGSSGDTDVAPTYSSVTLLTQGTNLETGIGLLDSIISSSTNSINVTPGDTTPTVLNGSGKQSGILITANVGSTVITTFDNGKAGQIITVLIGDNNTSFVHSASLALKNGIDFYAAAYDRISFLRVGSTWFEINRTLSYDYIVCPDTGDYSVLLSNFGKTLRFGSNSDRIINLPSVGSSNDGSKLTIIKTSGTGKLTIDAADTDYIDDSAAGGTIYTTDLYASISLEYSHAETRWIIISATQTWTTT